MGVKAELLGLSRFSADRTIARVHDLSDEEYLWEPAPHCWSIRMREGVPVSDGAVAAVAPGFTTIAWRMWHVINNYAGARNASWLGLAKVPDSDLEHTATPPITAADARSRLDRAIKWWHVVVEASTDELLAEEIGPIGGQWASYTKASLLMHELDEVIHHSAEIGVVRDLFRWTTQPYEPTLMEAVRDGQLAIALELLEDPTVDVNEVDTALGATPLHFAAGADNVELVRALLARGADPMRTDRTHQANARGWADYFGSTKVLPLLPHL